MTHALVTGASGFIGPHLVKRLIDQNVQVTCLVRESSDLSRLNLFKPELVYGDVMNPESLAIAVSGCDVVYHLAGLTKSIPAGVMRQVNELGVRNVAAACADESASGLGRSVVAGCRWLRAAQQTPDRIRCSPSGLQLRPQQTQRRIGRTGICSTCSNQHHSRRSCLAKATWMDWRYSSASHYVACTCCRLYSTTASR